MEFIAEIIEDKNIENRNGQNRQVVLCSVSPHPQEKAPIAADLYRCLPDRRFSEPVRIFFKHIYHLEYLADKRFCYDFTLVSILTHVFPTPHFRGLFAFCWRSMFVPTKKQACIRAIHGTLAPE